MEPAQVKIHEPKQLPEVKPSVPEVQVTVPENVKTTIPQSEPVKPTLEELVNEAETLFPTPEPVLS